MSSKLSKSLCFLILFAVSASFSVPPSVSATSQLAIEGVELETAPVSKSKKILNEFNALSDQNLVVSWDQENQSPSFLSGILSKTPAYQDRDIRGFLETSKELFKMQDPNKELKLNKQEKDSLGYTHFKYQQTYQGIPVYGSDFFVHTNKSNVISAINGKFNSTIYNHQVNVTPSIIGDKAIQFAKTSVETDLGSPIKLDDENIAEPSSSLIVYPYNKNFYLAYYVKLSFNSPEAGYWHIFVDATTGKVIDKYNAISHGVGATTGSGTGALGQSRSLSIYQDANNYYYMYDFNRKSYTYDDRDFLTSDIILPIDSLTTYFNDPAAVDAHYYTGIVYDYFKSRHAHNSFGGNNEPIRSFVHVADENGNPMSNAYWNGSSLNYGDGDGVEYLRPFSADLDVVAHEYTHAITEYTAGLEYRFQAGALNESISDIFAAIIDGNWTIGEDIGDPVRSLANPSLYNQPDKMSNYLQLPYDTDNGGVHINSGIPNKAAYLIANSLNMSGKDYNTILGKITFRALTAYLTPTSDFMDARNAFVAAAGDLYGSASVERDAVISAWNSVEVPLQTPAYDNFESNDSFSTAHTLALGNTIQSYISTPYDKDYYKFTVYAATNIRISLTNLPKDYDLDLWNSSNHQIAYSYNGSTTDDIIEILLSAGTYYIQVHNYSGFYNSSDQPYTLSVVDLNAVPVSLNAEITGTSLPASVNGGQAVTGTITVKNSGTETWTAASNVRLRISATGLDTRVLIPSDVSVASGQSIAFNVNLMAPATAGTWSLTAQMIKEGVQLFGPTQSIAINVVALTPLNAAITGTSFPATIEAGKAVSGTVTVKNTGSETWTAASNIRLRLSGTALDTRGLIPAGTSIAAGQSHTFSFSLTAPANAGNWALTAQMIKENVQFFGPTQAISINVTSTVPTIALDAQITGTSFPATVEAGKAVSGTVTVKNTGSETWTAATNIRLRLNGTGLDTRGLIPAGTSVPTGQSYTFSFSLTAPANAGNWALTAQMIKENVQFFGPTQAISINVTSTAPTIALNAQITGTSFPAAVEAGKTVSGTVTVKNTGYETWTAATNIRLRLNSTGLDTRGLIPAGTSVPSGQSYTFSVNLTAPATAGNWALTAQMIKEGVQLFGPTQAISINVTSTVPTVALDAQITGTSFPATVEAGKAVSGTVTVKNTGSETWTAATNIRLRLSGTGLDTRGLIPAGASVSSGQSYTFSFNLTAPATAGNWALTVQMLKENVQFFGAPTPIAINVTSSVPTTALDAQITNINFPISLVKGVVLTSATVTVKNLGSETWTAASNIRLRLSGTGLDTRGLIPVGTSVPTGQSITFSFNITAPATTGNWVLTAQMLKENVQFFGPTQNVTINIIEPAPTIPLNAYMMGSYFPSSVSAGQPVSGTVVVVNAGSETWTAASNIRLRISGTNLDTRVFIPNGISVGTNQAITFNVNLTAPASPGNWPLTFQMIKEGVQFFGPLSQSTIYVTPMTVIEPLSAEYLLESVDIEQITTQPNQ